MPASPHATAAPDTEVLFHLGYRFPADQPTLSHLFCDTRYVILCGSATRAHLIATRLHPTPSPNHCRTDRYTLLRPLPTVLVAAHGIGTGSVDALLHELHRALSAAGAPRYTLLRVGSCGGVGVAAGTVVVTTRPLNGAFEPVQNLHVLGEQRSFPACLDRALGDAMFRKGVQLFGERCVRGDTLCAETFYVAQGRRDGAFAGFSEAERGAFLSKCRRKGVVNFEMESLALAAFATAVDVPAAVVCAVLVDRLECETPLYGDGKLTEFQERAVKLVVGFVLDRLAEGDVIGEGFED